MAMVGCLLSSGRSAVPDLYQDQLGVSLATPRPGVEVVFCTDTHLVEVSAGSVLRTKRLCSSENKAGISEIRLLLGDTTDQWRYLLVMGVGSQCRVQILYGESLETEKEYSNVLGVTIEDYYKDGRRFAVLELSYGDKIVTNGESETVISMKDDDLDIMEISDESENGTVKPCDDILALRLEHISKAILAQEAELRMKQNLLRDSLRSLYLECGLDTELVIGDAGEACSTPVHNTKPVLAPGERDVKLRVDGHWIKVVRGESLVLGLTLTTGTEAVSNISLHLVNSQDSHLEYQWTLLRFIRPGILQSSSSMAASTSSVAVASFSLSSSLSSEPVTIYACVSFSCGESPDLVTDTIPVSLPTNILSDLSTINWSDREAERSLMGLHVTGLTKRLKIVTKLGSFNNFGDLLENNKFLYNQTLCSHIYVDPDHPLHHTVINLEAESSQRCFVNITTKSDLQATLVVRLLRSLLCFDAHFSNDV